MSRHQLPLVQRAFRQALTRWLDALSQYRSPFADDEDDPDRTSVHRLAIGLATYAATSAVEDVERAARAVAVAKGDRLAPRLEELLDAIRREMHPACETRGLVVVVTDDPATLERVVSATAPFTDRIETFSSTGAARAFTFRTPPGIVLLDADLPDDPLDWLIELRAAPGGPEVPVLVFARDGAVRPEVLTLGASEFLKKPLDALHLHTAIGTHLGHEARTMLELAGDPVTGLPGPGLFQEAVSDLGVHHEGRRWCVGLVAWRNRASLESEDAIATNRAALGIALSLQERFPDPSLVARLDQDTFALLIRDADAEQLMVTFEETIAALTESALIPLDLGIGGVLGLEAEYAPVLGTARRMHHLAAIAGQRVLLTTLDEAAQRRLLLVDDDIEIVDLLRETVRGTHLEVVHRRTAIEGLETAAASQFDLVLLNAALPNQGAFDLLKTLRGWPHYAARPLLMLTSDDRERVLAYELGADDCVATPFNPDVVRARLSGLIRDT